MRVIVLFLCATFSLYASNLLTHNIYERSDRIDVMLSFDAPYEGRILQKKEGDMTILTLEDLYFNEFVERTINSSILQALTLEPVENSTAVLLKSNQDISVLASKTVDGFGLRIRARLSSTPVQAAPLVTTPLPSTQSQSIVDGRYMLVIGIMLFLLLVLFWVKRKVALASSKGKATWLFPQGSNTEALKVLYQKPLDAANKVVLLEFEKHQYLIVTGSSNLLLERFGEGRVRDDGEFKNVFEQNRQKLDEYLRIQQNQLSSYKEKASQDFTPTR
ncbi:MAG: hypothetical protein IBX45_00700 [Campylobacterales bacterium]|nr:hypothetical protein [Campylobacterales bacterium]